MKISITVAALVAVSASTAAAQTVITEPAGDRDTTKISGTAGQEVVVHFKGQRGVMNGILWSERSDLPCWLKLHGFQRIDGEYRKVTREHAGCGENGASRKAVGVDAPGGGVARLVRGIQVCTNGTGRRLKGFRLWSIRADLDTGDLSDDGAPPVTRARNNCKTWHPKRFCPAGHIATGLILQTSGSTIQGAGLECSKIRVTRKMQRP